MITKIPAMSAVSQVYVHILKNLDKYLDQIQNYRQN